ncbi:methyltransferase domain-containing protein [Pseudoteredinibacter isoporae]|uniref:S-adenosylmethionine-dependent methyltransferase n=1 Tax=Pseudoteredinibacter isoporae TaxID=570281 RepID=A0A7X0JXG9_9GAMM|nr:methyltransferase domain-containing protein [Pseudoteredinibacter isoporae]MBB6523315.1 S-adenosylmethionine-dependent methyltransferase [Pseudoteredinibacter isoporae]NHO88829.1 methyltransferase domain-containing protein [Pseudoteredinibacter isoporae]NIB24463.1 methyltransferase domain-containing protein [Pseudoteredinibacter isoporae]
MSSPEGDRNFDDLVEHFAGKIYGNHGQQGVVQKGRLRHAVIHRDLQAWVPGLYPTDGLQSQVQIQALNILDIGAGLGQWVSELAEQGHVLAYNDISSKMTEQARELARQKLTDEHFARCARWWSKPYQELQSDIKPCSQDLILCHALIEWLQEPEKLFPILFDWLKPGACLSFCHYNPAGKRLRNLIFGNFKAVEKELQGEHQKHSSARGGLTPTNPSSIQDIDGWWQMAGFECLQQSAIRVFSDYTLEKRGGLSSPESVFDMEMAMSQDPNFVHSARYRHMVLRKPR